MSSFDRYEGRLVCVLPMDDETNKETLERVLGKEFNPELWEICAEGTMEQYCSVACIPSVNRKGILYVALDTVKKDPEDNYVNLVKRSDGSFNFTSQFDNGGTVLEEMLEEALEEYEKANKPNRGSSIRTVDKR